MLSACSCITYCDHRAFPLIHISFVSASNAVFQELLEEQVKPVNPLEEFISTRVLLHGSKHSKQLSSCHTSDSPAFIPYIYSQCPREGEARRRSPSVTRILFVGQGQCWSHPQHCCVQQLLFLMACSCDSLDMTFVCLPAYSYFVQLYFMLRLRFIYFFKSLLTCCQSQTKRLVFTVLEGSSRGIHGSHYYPETLVLVAYAVFLVL